MTLLYKKDVCLTFVHQFSAILYLTLSLTFAVVLFIEHFVIDMSIARKTKVIKIVETIPECIVFLNSKTDC